MSASYKNYMVVPPGELRCVYMTAGILSYQLCDRKYDCDNCSFDAAMRKHFVKQVPPHTSDLISSRSMVEREKLREDYRYSTNHCWLKFREKNAARVGIEPTLAAALLIPKAVVLPSIGQQVKKKCACVWIVTNEGTFPLASPLNGEIIATNRLSKDEPQELFLHPFDQGWLYDIKMNTNELDDPHLMNAEAARQRYEKDSIRFKDALLRVLHQTKDSAGITLADGGKPLQNISDMLGPKKYFDIVREMLG